MDGLQTSLNRAIERRFGRKQGVLRAASARLGLLAGRFSAFEAPDLESVTRLVCVCKGNICRSAYAEAVARKAGANAISFGLQAGVGRPADPMAAETASARGIDLGVHRSRNQVELQPGDLLAAMEPGHLERLQALARLAGAQVTLLGLWARPVHAHIEDPFGLSPAYFQTCFAIIEDAMRRLVTRWRAAR